MSNMLQDGQEILEGRFQIIKKLGSGAFGEIYKGKSRNVIGKYDRQLLRVSCQWHKYLLLLSSLTRDPITHTHTV